MGSTISQGNSSGQYAIQSTKKISDILKLYTFICQSYDSSLGKLKIFRKKQYNFDYIAQVDKLVERDYVDQLMKIAKINDIVKSQNSKISSDPHYLKLKSLTIIKDASLWLKIFGYEVIDQGSNQHFKRIKVCYQYFNFTLKDYLEKIPSTIKHNAYHIPPWIAYILATILDTYNQLKLLKIQHPHLNITPILSSITTPSFIYIDIEGCLKFLPIPFFIMTDYSSNVDQCLVHCCRFESEGEKMNVIVPKYGEGSMRKQDEGFDKTDKIFMARLKKLIKYIIKQIEFGDIRDSNGGGSEQTGTNTPQNIPINLHHPNSSFNSLNNQKFGLKYWEVLQNTQSLAQMIRIISSVEDIQNCLEILKSKNQNISNQCMPFINYPLNNHNNSSNRQDKKKLQKLGVQNRLATNNSQHTTNSLNIIHSNLNMYPYNLSQSTLSNNPGVDRKFTKAVSQQKYYHNSGKFYYL